MPAPSRSTRAPRATGLVLALLAGSGALVGCSDDSSKAASSPSSSPTSASSSGSASPSSSVSSSVSASPTASPTAERPTKPRFAPGEKGQRAFAEYVVDSWAYALATNDATAVTGLSPSKKQQCRGCKELAAELRKRDKEGWHVEFPGADIRRTTLKRDGELILATTLADIPASQSYFDDGSFRNDNDAHRGARFLVDLRIDGQAKKRHYVLLAFSLR